MTSRSLSPTNFAHLQTHEEQLARLGMLAERYLVDDPNTCLLKLRQFGELLAQTAAAKMGLYKVDGESQNQLVFRLQDEGVISREIYQLFGEIRRAGNEANHAFYGDQQKALNILKVAWQLGVWFQRAFVDPKFSQTLFVDPLPQPVTGLDWGKFGHGVRQVSEVALDDRTQLEQEVKQAHSKSLQRLVQEQEKAEQKKSKTLNKFRIASQTASQNLYLDEAATRQLIDDQLRQAGWEADTVNLALWLMGHARNGKKSGHCGMADRQWTCGLCAVYRVDAGRCGGSQAQKHRCFSGVGAGQTVQPGFYD